MERLNNQALPKQKTKRLLVVSATKPISLDLANLLREQLKDALEGTDLQCMVLGDGLSCRVEDGSKDLIEVILKQTQSIDRLADAITMQSESINQLTAAMMDDDEQEEGNKSSGYME